jgi:8-oxo-dGTP pyrophosphatase MutT (NUDIX family)
VSAAPRTRPRRPGPPYRLVIGADWRRARAIRASASAVIFDRGGRILLQQRSDGGQWGLPGGGVEIGESVTAAVVREVREETGLRVTVRRLIGVYSEPSMQVVRYPDGNVWHYVTVCFECTVRGGRLTTCDETLALEWVSPRRLPKTILPNHIIRIRDARRRRARAFVR